MKLAKVWYKDKDEEFRFTRFENIATMDDIRSAVGDDGCNAYISDCPYFYREEDTVVVMLSSGVHFEIPSAASISKADANKVIRGMKLAGERLIAIRRKVVRDERYIEI